ncbi:preprotein translocase subunit SecE [Streptococcus ovuberis]|uniref:Preprotein translocase subunit SecE n=1 Tax=Streptococcus ovuberis TaxID=1936207 RepID=A0A7X6N093_9STRE|nr:preprotein translocase subunit SecE [Streptococcus ovuberis]NKZ21083.1 preprotein translocase subunit SecE [Streptococcus ovuberis]
MKFISDTLQILADTTWPDNQQRWSDFLSVLEYTAFFVAVIYLYDLFISRGVLSLINLF